MNPRRRPKPQMPPRGPRSQKKPQAQSQAQTQFGNFPYYPHYYWDDYYYWDYYHNCDDYHWRDYYLDDYYWDDYYYSEGQKPHRRNKTTKQIQTVTVDVPLMIRLLEFAREDSKSDIDLHKIVGRMIEMSEHGESLTMEEYSDIVMELEEYTKPQSKQADGS